MQVVRDIIERLEIHRLENRITQEALAKRLGVAFSTVNRWFNRRSRPSKIQAYHIEKLLKNASKRGRKKRMP
jgi:transcriptional regulator with XRE-family HTH domain